MFSYHVKVKRGDIKICKEEFVSLHGLQNSLGRIKNIQHITVSGMTSPKQDCHGKHKSHAKKYSKDAIAGVHEHINPFLIIIHITPGHRIHIKPTSIWN
jgi:hypothetical protein